MSTFATFGSTEVDGVYGNSLLADSDEAMVFATFGSTEDVGVYADVCLIDAILNSTVDFSINVNSLHFHQAVTGCPYITSADPTSRVLGIGL